jgi:hypothetical protein
VQCYRERAKHSQRASRLAVPEQTNSFASRLVAIPPRVIDVVLAGFLVFWTAVESTNDGEPLWATLLLSAAALALVARRRWPLAVLLIALVPYAITQYTGTGQPAVLVALYTVASLRSEPHRDLRHGACRRNLNHGGLRARG